MTSRRFSALAQELWPDSECDYGQIAWWAANLPHGETEVRLWHDDGRLVGWGWVTGGTELEFDVRPSHRHLLDEILDWAQPEELRRPLGSRGRDRAHRGARARARSRGAVVSASTHARWSRSTNRACLTAIASAPSRRATGRRGRAAHRSAFQPSRFSDDVYAFVRTTPAYRADLDCVVEAPDGSIAAYTLAWFDEVNRVGEFEPVGTHADHRRLGLGRAVGLYALRRLRELGATSALVACRGDAAYPIPCKLYESIGFREVSRHIAFRRPG